MPSTKRVQPQQTLNSRPVMAFSPTDLAAATYNSRTGEPLKSVNPTTTGYGVKGRKVDAALPTCYCKVVESPGSADDLRYYIGINNNGMVIDPITGGGSGDTTRIGWIPVSKDDFDRYYQDIKNAITTMNISIIREKYSHSIHTN